MKLVNIYNDGRNVYLFERLGRELHIIEDNTFYPFYYEPDPNGTYNSYDGKKLRKISVHHPAEVSKNRSALSYSSDIHFTKNYLIHNVAELQKTNIKYFLLDIEVLAKEIPNVKTAKQPISCVSIYNSESDSIVTFWLNQYPGTLEAQESALINDLLDYFETEKPDLWLSWNVDFDYEYLHNRIKEFATKISPVHKTRSGSDYEIFYPAGISILDYMLMFKKVFMREPSYTLDAISQKYLGEETWGSSNFGELTDDIRLKNINDVKRLQKLEQKFKIIEYFDEIRRLTKTAWEDLYHNSFIVENLLLIEAKKKNIILPNRPKYQEKSEEDDTFEGASREAVQTGALFDIGKFDLTSAYPNMVVNFCLDATNIVEDDSGTDINGIKFQQDSSALLPSMVKNILQLKDKIKEDLKKCKHGSEEYANTKIKYDAIKGVVNSAFGVMGFSSFRLYDNRIASSITYLVRDLLSHVRGELERIGYRVIYWDTDSTFIATKEDLSVKLNEMVQNWAKTKYNKNGISLGFEYEGYFEKIFIVALCRYVGYLVSTKGVIREIKGAEAKRANSSKYEGGFQLTLIDKILNKESREAIVTWVTEEKKRIKTLPIEDIAFPCKVSTKEYNKVSKTGKKLVPIFVRALNNTNFIKKLSIPVGELFWWVYVNPMRKDVDGKDMDVFAFTKSDKSVINKQTINWDEMIRRNIQQKAFTIFEANKWSTLELIDNGQMQLI
jgi:DNA polymerase elongation subunit (family B)